MRFRRSSAVQHSLRIASRPETPEHGRVARCDLEPAADRKNARSHGSIAASHQETAALSAASAVDF